MFNSLYCFILLPLFVEFSIWTLLCIAVLSVLTSFAIIVLRKRELMVII